MPNYVTASLRRYVIWLLIVCFGLAAVGRSGKTIFSLSDIEYLDDGISDHLVGSMRNVGANFHGQSGNFLPADAVAG